VRFTLRPADRTLTDEETEAYRASLLERLERELGVGLRGPGSAAS
jgi:phenylalanyl-tRNA synthetase beta subunit